MTLGRARILKHDAGAAAAARGADATFTPPATLARRETLARRVPALVVDARAEAERIMREACAAADGILADARASGAILARDAVREAREHELARVAAELLALRVDEERRADRHLDRTIEIAALLAERIVGDTLALDPTRVAALAQGALRETRGARRIRIEACSDDVAALEAMLDVLGEGLVTIEVASELTRGSLVVHTELGRVDARLAPQLGRLAEALRETLRTDPASRRSPRE